MLERLGDRISLLGRSEAGPEPAAEKVPKPVSEAPVTSATEK
jgi:hypothetical protein